MHSLLSVFLTLLVGASNLAAASTIVPLAPLHDHSRHVDKSGQKPVGKYIKLGRNITTYVSKPRGSYAKDTAVVVLTDVFGIGERNNLLLTDHFAEAGFQTYTPDYFFGDWLKMSDFTDPNFNGTDWLLVRHSEAVTTPALLSVLSALKSQGIRKIGVTGYCFGGLYATRLAQNNTVTVSTMVHPALLQVPEDFVYLNSVGKVPVQVISAELDTTLTPELAVQIDPKMDGYKPGYARVHFTGVGHSFATANTTGIVDLTAKEAAFQAGVVWMKTAFKAAS